MKPMETIWQCIREWLEGSFSHFDHWVYFFQGMRMNEMNGLPFISALLCDIAGWLKCCVVGWWMPNIFSFQIS